MKPGGARLAWGIAAGALVVAACSQGSSTSAYGPACNGVSPAGLTTEATPDGQCPSQPTHLTGTATVGQPCSDPAACAPTCCTCPGTGTKALVAHCSNGNCLDGATACCLFSQQCAN
jgi:hypothetical protein